MGVGVNRMLRSLNGWTEGRQPRGLARPGAPTTSAKPARLVRQPSLELIAPGDAVSNKKNRWETGEVTTAAKMAPCKDTEGINIGVSDLINQWGKGKSEPDGAQSPPKPLVTYLHFY
ncbi:lymphocyte-specific 1 isoform X1 [Pelobates cultripes]|uniref:Lymphocyte-specific 1 isoform X1 n=1 Tax=Pelobates cultripes TaxID=61616 RepID=A0AAD1TKR1_PELCU|nr:lymphocyte-specific 1 isoform X1 [Pelobates cultripes]